MNNILSARVDDETYKRVEELSVELEICKSDLVRKSVNSFLDRCHTDVENETTEKKEKYGTLQNLDVNPIYPALAFGMAILIILVIRYRNRKD